MKKLTYILMAVLAVFVTACSPDDYSMGDKNITSDDLVEGIAYTVTHDSSNPNIVYLKSLLPSGYTILWDEPQGRSQESEVTLKLPFAGEYQVRMGVETPGGVVYGPYTTFTIDDFCAEFVTDELWSMLAGGVGKSKKWIYNNGKYGYQPGELSYGDPSANTNFGWNSFVSNWDPDAGHTGDANMWDSYMTFDLNGNANYQFYNSSTGKTQTGIFNLDTDTHMLNLTDADLMHPDTWTARRSDWRRDLQIVELDDNHLRVGYKRLTGDWGGEWIEVFNYVSEDYAKNYDPGEEEEVVPTLASDWRDYVEPKTSHVMTFKLNEDQPYDWCNKDGSAKGVASTAASGIEDLTFSFNNSTSKYTVTTPDGTEYTGSYTLDDDGIYTFDGDFPTLTLSEDGEVTFSLSSDNTLRILAYETDDYSGSLTNIWLGKKLYDDQGNLWAYQGYQFTLQTGSTVKRYTGSLHLFDTSWAFQQSENVYITTDGDYTFTINGSCSDVYGIYLDIAKLLKDYPNCDVKVVSIKADGNDVAFDDAAIDRGVGDDSNTARRYIVNPWGATASTASAYSFSSSLSVTVHVTLDNGTPFVTTDAAKALSKTRAAKRSGVSKRYSRR
ncbi:MAG: hypothetical protein ACOYJF_01810 [Prevotella sp.]|jgi:hypothetical protein